jgi:hypothetical protein
MLVIKFWIQWQRESRSDAEIQQAYYKDREITTVKEQREVKG